MRWQILLEFDEQIGQESPTGWLSLSPENYNTPQVVFKRGEKHRWVKLVFMKKPQLLHHETYPPFFFSILIRTSLKNS